MKTWIKDEKKKKEGVRRRAPKRASLGWLLLTVMDVGRGLGESHEERRELWRPSSRKAWIGTPVSAPPGVDVLGVYLLYSFQKAEVRERVRGPQMRKFGSLAITLLRIYLGGGFVLFCFCFPTSREQKGKYSWISVCISRDILILKSLKTRQIS